MASCLRCHFSFRCQTINCDENGGLNFPSCRQSTEHLMPTDASKCDALGLWCRTTDVLRNPDRENNPHRWLRPKVIRQVEPYRFFSGDSAELVEEQMSERMLVKLVESLDQEQEQQLCVSQDGWDVRVNYCQFHRRRSLYTSFQIIFP